MFYTLLAEVTDIAHEGYKCIFGFFSGVFLGIQALRLDSSWPQNETGSAADRRTGTLFKQNPNCCCRDRALELHNQFCRIGASGFYFFFSQSLKGKIS